jgi:hypothetical protein
VANKRAGSFFAAGVAITRTTPTSLYLRAEGS